MKRSKKSLNYFEAHPNKRKPLKVKYTKGPDYKLRNYKRNFIKAVGGIKEISPILGALATVIHRASQAFGGLSHAIAHTSLGRVAFIPGGRKLPEMIQLTSGDMIKAPDLVPIATPLSREQLLDLNDQHDPGDEDPHIYQRLLYAWITGDNLQQPKKITWMEEANKALEEKLKTINPDQNRLRVADFHKKQQHTWSVEPEPGYCEGDICNRDGCNGKIAKHDLDGGCSCHINPPCSYCETAKEYCPACGWDGKEEQDEYNAIAYKPSEAQQKAWEEERNKWNENEKKFNAKFYGNDPITEFECRRKSHTHFSMEVIGVYPEGMTMGEVLEKVAGTFGGRFVIFGKGKFKYIAYTD